MRTRTAMDMRLFALVLLSIALGARSVARAQSALKQDVEQCDKARDLAFCPVGLPACERLLAGLAAAPADPSSLDKIRSVTLNISTDCANALGQYSKSEGYARKELELAIRIHGPEHPIVAGHLNDLAAMLFGHGKHEAAESLFRQALAMKQKLLGAEHPDVAIGLHNLAGVLNGQGRYEAAETLHRQALAMRKKLLGAEHPDVTQSLNGLAPSLPT